MYIWVGRSFDVLVSIYAKEGDVFRQDDVLYMEEKYHCRRLPYIKSIELLAIEPNPRRYFFSG